MRKIFLKLVGEKQYQLFNANNDELTEAMYFDDYTEALKWANGWASSWSDVVLEVE